MNEVRQERGRQSSRGQQGLSSSIGSGFSANLARTLSPRRPDEFPRWNSGSSMREDATDGSSPHSKGDSAVDLAVSDGPALSHSNASTTLPDPEVNAPSAELDVPQASQTRGLRRSISNPLRAPPGPAPLGTTPPTMGSASRPVSRTAVTPPVRASSGRQRRWGIIVAVVFFQLLSFNLASLTSSARLGSTSSGAVAIPPHRLRPIEDPNQVCLSTPAWLSSRRFWPWCTAS